MMKNYALHSGQAHTELEKVTKPTKELDGTTKAHKELENEWCAEIRLKHMPCIWGESTKTFLNHLYLSTDPASKW